MSQPQFPHTQLPHTKQRWVVALLVAMMMLLPSLPVAAATPTTASDEGRPTTTLDPGQSPNPFLNRTLQPLPVSHTAPLLSTETALPEKWERAAPVVSTVALTTTPTTTVSSDINVAEATTESATAPADDAYQAWNSRPAVTRADAYPVRITIPALKIDTFVEQLGERADGSMATPTNPSNVAWYSYGAIPGENGNVVMAGHLDRADGSPAAFWNLAKLKAGDEVIVYDSIQTAYHYTVTDQQSYPYNKAPLDQIFGFDLVSRLNLITCRGNWDRNRQTYSQRLVVYTELVEIVPATNP